MHSIDNMQVRVNPFWEKNKVSFTASRATLDPTIFPLGQSCKGEDQ